MKNYPVYGRSKEPVPFKGDQDVMILSGKYKGRRGYISHQTYAHPLNPEERMWCVRMQTGSLRGWITLRLQEKNIGGL